MLCLSPSEEKRVPNVGESAWTVWKPEPKFLTYQKLIRQKQITCPRPPTVHCMDNKDSSKMSCVAQMWYQKWTKTTQCVPILRFYYCSPTSRSFLNQKKSVIYDSTSVCLWWTSCNEKQPDQDVAYIYSHTHGVPSSQPPILLFPCFFIIGKHTRQARTDSWQALIVLHICLCTEVMSDHTTICEISCLWKRPSGIAATNSRCVVSSSEGIVWRVRVQRIRLLKKKKIVFISEVFLTFFSNSVKTWWASGVWLDRTTSWFLAEGNSPRLPMWRHKARTRPIGKLITIPKGCKEKKSKLQ